MKIRLGVPARAIPVLALAALALTACGTFTGIPSHGGGKRFAIEQELVAATARAVAKDIDVTPLVGRRAAMFVVVMGDQGSGNLAGGRYSIEAALRGQYSNLPSIITSNRFPTVPGEATTTTGDVVSTTVTTSVLDSPSRSKVTTDDAGFGAEAGVRYQGLSAYRSEAFINPNDVQFLSAVLQEVFTLRGVILVPPDAAEVDIFVTVDVFGTVRRRVDWHIANQERLLAKTALEVIAIERGTGKIILKPTVSAFEAEYIEQYYLWAGPVWTVKEVRRSDPLLVDFTSLEIPSAVSRAQGITPPVFSKATGAVAASADVTRPKPLTRPLAAPDPSRPEDVKKVLQ